jgi:hypothetical protein
MMFRRKPPPTPTEPVAVAVFKAFAAALAGRDWEQAAGYLGEEIDARWRGCGQRASFTRRDAYLAAWQEVLNRDDRIDFHNVFGDDTRVAAEYTRWRLNGLSRLSGTVICDVRDGLIVREFTHEVPGCRRARGQQGRS